MGCPVNARQTALATTAAVTLVVTAGTDPLVALAAAGIAAGAAGALRLLWGAR